MRQVIVSLLLLAFSIGYAYDEGALLERLAQDPQDGSAMISLAQVYRDLKQYDKAIFWYEKRIDQKNGEEEIWYATFMIATIYEELGNWEKAFKAYEEAFQYRPTRAEPLYRMARYFRGRGQHELAYRFAAQASKIPYPQDQLLVQKSVYDYQIDEEMAISGYYTQFREEGFVAVDRLLLSKNIPGGQRALAENNAFFYIGNLKNTRFKPVEFNKPYIREDLQIPYNSMNPSICKTEDGYLVICRCVNYGQKGGHHLWMLDPSVPKGRFCWGTRNFLLRYDRDFQLISQHEIIDKFSPLLRVRPYTLAEGIEDIRIFQYQDSLYFTGTIYDIDSYHVTHIGLFQLEEATEGDFVFTKQCTPLIGRSPGRYEKNWMPIIIDDAIHMVYSYDPLVIYKVNATSGKCEEVVHEEQKYRLCDFRGSGPPVPFDDGYLMVIHQVFFRDNERVYLHRFVYLDKDYRIEKISRPFTFVHQGIEYCCGLAIDHANADLIMTIGIEDARGFFVFIDLDSVRQTLCHVIK